MLHNQCLHHQWLADCFHVALEALLAVFDITALSSAISTDVVSLGSLVVVVFGATCAASVAVS
jgi:hypothetical protein